LPTSRALCRSALFPFSLAAVAIKHDHRIYFGLGDSGLDVSGYPAPPLMIGKAGSVPSSTKRLCPSSAFRRGWKMASAGSDSGDRPGSDLRRVAFYLRFFMGQAAVRRVGKYLLLNLHDWRGPRAISFIVGAGRDPVLSAFIPRCAAFCFDPPPSPAESLPALFGSRPAGRNLGTFLLRLRNEAAGNTGRWC